MKRCEECTFYHPERPKKPCSGFGELQNQNGDCSLYIHTGKKEEPKDAEGTEETHKLLTTLYALKEASLRMQRGEEVEPYRGKHEAKEEAV